MKNKDKKVSLGTDDLQKCSEEVSKILKKYNAALSTRTEPIIVPKKKEE